MGDNIFATSRHLRRTDYHTLAFINGRFCNLNPEYPEGVHADETFQPVAKMLSPKNCHNSIARYICIDTFDSAGLMTMQGCVENSIANAGAYNPNLTNGTLNPYDLRITDQAILYVGVGPQNIINSAGWLKNSGGTIDAPDFNNVATYRIYAKAQNGTRLSDYYLFDIIDNDCRGYETIRLAYLNRQGAWDYYNFTKKSQKSTNITRSNFKQFYGSENYSTHIKQNLCNTWDYGAFEGGTKTYNVNAINVIEANTDFITEAESVAFEELFTSSDVYMYVPRSTEPNQNANQWVPVVVTEKDYIKQTQANDKLIQYIIQIQQGHETRIQSL